MFQNRRINIIFRIVCLMTFIVVIIFNRSFITLSLITIFFYAFTRREEDLLIFFWHIITIIAFLISYFTNSIYLLKIVLVVGLSYYFIVNPYDSVNKVKRIKTQVVDKYFIRFKNSTLRKDVIDMNLINAIYITVHLFILFITIMVG